ANLPPATRPTPDSRQRRAGAETLACASQQQRHVRRRSPRPRTRRAVPDNRIIDCDAVGSASALPLCCAKGGGVSDFRNRPVLVLGGLGFIGGRLADRLLTTGAKVTIVTPSRDRHVETAALFEARGARILEADMRDGAAMSAAVAQQDVIFNLAGQSGAVRSMEDPWTDLDVNCRGNLSLLEAVRVVNREAKIVFAGSRLEYGHPPHLPVT